MIAQFSGLLGSGGTETMQRLLVGTYDLDFCVSVIVGITLLVTA